MYFTEVAVNRLEVTTALVHLVVPPLAEIVDLAAVSTVAVTIIVADGSHCVPLQ